MRGRLRGENNGDFEHPQYNQTGKVSTSLEIGFKKRRPVSDFFNDGLLISTCMFIIVVYMVSLKHIHYRAKQDKRI